ncbi:MAG TPA: hypothetical protein VLT88_11075, partial [Desulfosarcina sp.]|nr:hypothetical protein [Desulfosarcina sp.]
KDPKFALGAATASLQWLARGHGYEVAAVDVHAAYDHAMQAAAMLGMQDQVAEDLRKVVDQDASPGKFVKEILGRFFK